ncbi:DUF2975 domain-containing protein [Streptomyces sp. ME02-6991-2A]|uniref:DUF2975 domain-containing protein n=1 Tax=Streptomyces sp. ME02-6991-2A TaxID=3028677 RepID=UPI0029A69360|nr:DUF2975 domain-containing protein [Streptomyces sp. ME02-6991-2A]MDX3379462.1 DUF2975 domain-containing protein [Streptomyces sp. ME02-6991-2A]
MHSLLVGILRIGIAAAVLFGLFAQAVIIPTTAADEVDLFAPYEPYALPYVIASILGVACVQVALGAIWMLLAKVERDAIFTRSAFRWVDLIIGAAVVATLIALGAAVHLTLDTIPSPDDGMAVEGALLAALACAAVGAAFSMLMVIMRTLLGKAMDMRTELAEVI